MASGKSIQALMVLMVTNKTGAVHHRIVADKPGRGQKQRLYFPR